MRADPLDEQPRSFPEEIGKEIDLWGKGEYPTQILGCRSRTLEYEQTIWNELGRPNPNDERIRHREVDIDPFRIEINRAETRLGRASRTGSRMWRHARGVGTAILYYHVHYERTKPQQLDAEFGLFRQCGRRGQIESLSIVGFSRS